MESAPLYLIFLLLWIASLWPAIRLCQLGRISKRQEREPLRADVPPASIVIACHNNAPQLRENLPALLQQEYPTEFEVIVVDMHSTDETKDLLENFAYTYPHLHHTHCPTTARDISLQRLALTLGVRAAAHEWIVFTEADCTVSGPQWLLHMTQPCTDERDAVLGVMLYDEDGTWRGRKFQFFHLWQQTLWLPHAIHHAPYQADGAALCYRRSHFMQHQGFASSALWEVGAETLLVNHNIRAGRCDANLRPQAIVRKPLPTNHKWREDSLRSVATHHQIRQGFLYLLSYAFRETCHLLFPLSAISLFAVAWGNPYVMVPVALMWLALIVLRLVMFRQTTRQLGIRSFNLSLPWLLHMPLIWGISAWLRWLGSDKKMFRKKFV